MESAKMNIMTAFYWPDTISYENMSYFRTCW